LSPNVTFAQVLRVVFEDDWIGQQRFTPTPALEVLYDTLQVGPGAHVLELASGTGGPALALARRSGCHVTGIDADAENVRCAGAAAEAAGLARRVRFVAGDVGIAHFSAGAFDAIVSHDAFVTVLNKVRLLARCRRLLRDDGRLAAVLIVRRGALTAPPEWSSLLAWPILSLEEYRSLMELAGLRVLAIEDLTPTFREVSARWRGALHAWEAELFATLGIEQLTQLQRAIGTLAAWATQGHIGQVRLLAVPQR
jgi:cyclopropane fatty-acyl-phospholipid synthase-like methyltransferase